MADESESMADENIGGYVPPHFQNGKPVLLIYAGLSELREFTRMMRDTVVDVDLYAALSDKNQDNAVNPNKERLGRPYEKIKSVIECFDRMAKEQFLPIANRLAESGEPDTPRNIGVDPCFRDELSQKAVLGHLDSIGQWFLGFVRRTKLDPYRFPSIDEEWAKDFRHAAEGLAKVIAAADKRPAEELRVPMEASNNQADAKPDSIHPSKSTDLAERTAEIRAAEEMFQIEQEQEWEREGRRHWSPMPFWSTADGYARLRSIEERYRIKREDLRVYSIAAYKAEKAQIQAEFDEATDGLEEDDPAALGASRQLRWRLEDCEARHAGFRGQSIKTASTVAELWHALGASRLIWRNLHVLGNRDAFDRISKKDLSETYSALIRLNLDDMVPPAPYPTLTLEEAGDTLARIANELERREGQHVISAGLNPTPTGTPYLMSVQPNSGTSGVVEAHMLSRPTVIVSDELSEVGIVEILRAKNIHVSADLVEKMIGKHRDTFKNIRWDNVSDKAITTRVSLINTELKAMNTSIQFTTKDQTIYKTGC